MKHWSKSRWSLAQLVVPVAAALVASGCGGLAEDYCEALCECEKCNDRQADQCLIDTEGRLDVAQSYECSGPAEDYYNCRIDSSECNDENHWVLLEDSQEVRLNLWDQIGLCIADHSGIYGEDTPYHSGE